MIELTTYLDVQCTLTITASGMEVASVADSRRVVKLCYDNQNNNIASNLKLWFANKNDPRGNAECLRLGEREVTTRDQTSTAYCRATLYSRGTNEI